MSEVSCVSSSAVVGADERNLISIDSGLGTIRPPLSGTGAGDDQIVHVTDTAKESYDDTVFSLAKAFLNIDSMTHKKLQKLCYYAKAWYLALYDTNLIGEAFEAWVHGAVQPALYHKYKAYGFSEIPKSIDTSGVPEEYLSFAREVYESYGILSGDELERLNHQEEPWIKARGSARPWERCNNTISETDMKNYYRKMMSS